MTVYEVNIFGLPGGQQASLSDGVQTTIITSGNSTVRIPPLAGIMGDTFYSFGPASTSIRVNVSIYVPSLDFSDRFNSQYI